MKASARGRLLVGALLAFSLSGEVQGQEAAPGSAEPDAAVDLDRYEGRWVAVRDGRLALWVDLRREGDQLVGALSWRDDPRRWIPYAEEEPPEVRDKRTGTSTVLGCRRVIPVPYFLDELSPLGRGTLPESRRVTARRSDAGLRLRGAPRKPGAAPSELMLRRRGNSLVVTESENAEGDGVGLHLVRRDALFVAALNDWSHQPRRAGSHLGTRLIPSTRRLNAIRRGLSEARATRIADDYRETLCLLRDLVPDASTSPPRELAARVRGVASAAGDASLCDLTGARLDELRAGPFGRGCRRVRHARRAYLFSRSDSQGGDTIGVVEGRVGGWVLVGTEPSDAQLPFAARRFGGVRDWFRRSELRCTNAPIVSRAIDERESIEAEYVEPWWPVSLDDAIRAERLRQACAEPATWTPRCIPLAARP